MLRHFVSRDSSVGKRISGRNLYENSISAHQSNLQQFDRSHYRKYFSSPEKWQFFEEKPLHPSLLSDVSIESDITIERGKNSKNNVKNKFTWGLQCFKQLIKTCALTLKFKMKILFIRQASNFIFSTKCLRVDAEQNERRSPKVQNRPECSNAKR